MLDECNVCGGYGIAPGKCDCENHVTDCKNDCNGNAVVDVCNVCGGLGKPEEDCDCLGN